MAKDTGIVTDVHDEPLGTVDRSRGITPPETLASDRGAEPSASDATPLTGDGDSSGTSDDFNAGVPTAEKDRGVAEEVAPRGIGTTDNAGPAAAPVPGSGGAVDENRPADLVAQQGQTDLTGARHRPSVLDRQHAVPLPGRTHPETAGEDLVEGSDPIRGDVTT